MIVATINRAPHLAQAWSAAKSQHLLARAFACLRQHTSSRVAASGCEALSAIIRGEGFKDVNISLRREVLQHLLDALQQHPDSELVTVVSLDALGSFSGRHEDHARLARDGGAIPAVLCAVRHLPQSRAVNELAWPAIDIIASMCPPEGSFSGAPSDLEVAVDENAVSRLRSAGGLELALATLPHFRQNVVVARAIIKNLSVLAIGREQISETQRSAIVKVCTVETKLTFTLQSVWN